MQKKHIAQLCPMIPMWLLIYEIGDGYALYRKGSGFRESDDYVLKVPLKRGILEKKQGLTTLRAGKLIVYLRDFDFLDENSPLAILYRSEQCS
jgi:hypothetical protein